MHEAPFDHLPDSLDGRQTSGQGVKSLLAPFLLNRWQYPYTMLGYIGGLIIQIKKCNDMANLTRG